jgi:cold-inducible RNA-binding protein
MSKLYVGNLSFQTTEQDLSAAFAAYQPTAVTIVMDRSTGQSKGFGFVTCGTQELANEATQTSIELGGRTLKVDIARPPSESGSFGGGGRRSGSGFGGRSNGGGYSNR